ncbi:hypothetical protein KL930_001190 [Ogataea haglerorum]|nr:hypothetical protein KL915_005201 [Ogataea haglerorum]KAG7706192.1 hypothetical protein KL914_003087 [Ogataea haglerorum]KAG7708095.1 hypothetical protein KL950_002721 [Ogataea haglerorum]KAG7738053.1 hypothetical protein KL923_003600 [Ogataea haglerorum]KAG7780265.1 hypothetical protein KL922_000616 [Ogataea haglerorum]
MGGQDRRFGKRKTQFATRQKKSQGKDTVKVATGEADLEKDKESIGINYNDLAVCCLPFIIPANHQINERKYSKDINLNLLYKETSNPRSLSYKSATEISRQHLMNDLIGSMQMLGLISDSAEEKRSRFPLSGLYYSDSEEPDLDDDVDVENRLAQTRIKHSNLFDPMGTDMKTQNTVDLVTHEDPFNLHTKNMGQLGSMVLY